MAEPETTPPERGAVLRVTSMPADANPYGDIFGGWLMSQMDLAAGSIASRHSGGRAVTIAVEGMKFHRPVIVGDEVSVYGEVIRVGRTSMTIDIQAWSRARHGEERHLVTQALFTFVAIDEARRPRPVRPEQAVA
jgi:acyl-CoA thioesterase YciA